MYQTDLYATVYRNYLCLFHCLWIRSRISMHSWELIGLKMLTNTVKGIASSFLDNKIVSTKPH